MSDEKYNVQSTWQAVKYAANRLGHWWDDISDLIIRPPRSQYSDLALGPKVFRVDYRSEDRFEREDLTVENMRGMKLQCSWYRPSGGSSRLTQPCVVYLHGNSGSRIDAQEALPVLAAGFSLFSYDASGSGQSDGDHVSLGYFERQDLAAVIEYLHHTARVSNISLWGRSMGAVTAIMYAARDPSVRCIVCDSPFSSLKELVHDLVSVRFVPTMAIDAAVSTVRRNVVERAHFDIYDLDAKAYAATCDVPALIFHGADDTFVAPHHSAAVAAAYRGPCTYLVVPGDHNTRRPASLFDNVTSFLTVMAVHKAAEPVRFLTQSSSPGGDEAILAATAGRNSSLASWTMVNEPAPGASTPH